MSRWPFMTVVGTPEEFSLDALVRQHLQANYPSREWSGEEIEEIKRKIQNDINGYAERGMTPHPSRHLQPQHPSMGGTHPSTPRPDPNSPQYREAVLRNLLRDPNGIKLLMRVIASAVASTLSRQYHRFFDPRRSKMR